MNRAHTQQQQQQQHVMTFQKKSHDELPAGEYYVGDLSSFLPAATGTYINAQGHGFYMTKTACAEGEFAGSNKKSYIVDSGTIGVCAVELVGSDGMGQGVFYRFTQPVSIVMEEGVLTLSSGGHTMTIDTTQDVYVGSDDDGYDSWS
jgi:hypothetical protein